MARKSVQDATAKWQQRVAQSGQYYQQGVQNPGVTWAANAVAAADRRNQGLQRAIASGAIDAGIQQAGDSKWRNNTIAKGVPAWTQNTPKAAPAFQAGLQKAYGYMDAAESATSSMARTTRQDRIARAAAFLNAVGEAADQAKGR